MNESTRSQIVIRASDDSAAPLFTELLILPDGQILVHNLTRPFAELLAELNPDCKQIASRLASPAPCPAARTSLSHELSDGN